MSQELTLYDDLSALGRAAQVANAIAQEQTLADYRQGKAPKMLERQRDDIALFERYLAEACRWRAWRTTSVCGAR